MPFQTQTQFSAVDAGLKDPHPYVREASVIGVLKCHHQDPHGTKMRGYTDTIRTMLATDTDPQVVANCLYVLEQLHLLTATPPIITRPLVVSLLNHIRAFSDWSQCLVLDVLLKYYRPASESERFDVLEVLDFGLNHTNSAVVMSTAKLFLHYTASYPDQHEQVLESIRGPLQTMLLGREPEIVYATLNNLLILAQRHPAAFAPLATDFFCRPEDPSYLKLLKLDALVAVTDARNAFDVAEECAQYAKDAESDIARAAVRAVAKIALKVPDVDGILDRLLLFLSTGREEDVGEEAVAAMADVLRRFPGAADACVPAIAEVDVKSLKSGASRAALVWVLGEFGHSVQDAPYTLETMVGGFSGEPTQVKLSLLSNVAKLFFKRPPECRKSLGLVLQMGAQDGDAAVRARALFYHRLLSEAGPEAAQQIIAGPRPSAPSQGDNSSSSPSSMSTALPPEVLDRIFDEWNSLSTVYRAPAATFIEDDDNAGGGAEEEEGGDEHHHHHDDDLSDEQPETTALLMDLGDGEGSVVGLGTTPPAGPSTGSSSVTDFLEVMDLSGGGGGTSGLGSGFGFGGGSATAAAATTATTMESMLGELLGPTPSTTVGGGGGGGGVGVEGDITNGGLLGDDLDAFFGGGGGGGGQQQQQEQQITTITLTPKPAISASEFQSDWSSLELTGTVVTATQEVGGGGASTLATLSSRGYRDFSDHVSQANIASFATPREGSTPPLRFLFHAKRSETGARVLAQVTVTTTTAAVLAEMVVRSSDAAAAQHVLELLQTLLITL